MGRSRLLSFQVVAAIALAAAGAPAQEGSTPRPPAGEAPAAVPAKKGIKARLGLASGRVLDGVLPQGETWEAPDSTGGFSEVQKEDPRAGLRLYFVQGIKDAMFIPRGEISSFEDLGPLVASTERELRSEEVALAVRRRKLDEMERKNREEMERILEEARTGKKAPAPLPTESSTTSPAPVAGTGEQPAGAKPAGDEGGEAKDETVEELSPRELRRRQGDALLERFPSPDWSEKRANEIKWRERVTDMKRDQEEAAFIEGLELWKEALARRNAPAPAPEAKADGTDNRMEGAGQ